MRSSVLNENPLRRPPALAVVMSTHSSVCLEIRPMPNGLGPSAQRSAISSISASPSIVQSLVSTSIAISPDASDSACWSPSILPDDRGVPNP